jgi:hypothetical protein
MVLRFGKHKGQTLEDIPFDYLLWLKGVAQGDRLREAIDAELGARRVERANALTARPLTQLSPEAREFVRAVVRRGFRALAAEVHPDHDGGTTERMRALNEAHAALLGLVGAR